MLSTSLPGYLAGRKQQQATFHMVPFLDAYNAAFSFLTAHGAEAH